MKSEYTPDYILAHMARLNTDVEMFSEHFDDKTIYGDEIEWNIVITVPRLVYKQIRLYLVTGHHHDGNFLWVPEYPNIKIYST